MSDSKAQQEPSMEDILASIRRILSEDGEEEAKAEPEKAAPAAKAEPEPDPEPEPDLDALFSGDALASEPEPEPEDDVLELTEDMLEEPEEEAAPEAAMDFDLGLGDGDTEEEFDLPPLPAIEESPAGLTPEFADALDFGGRLGDDDDSLISPPTAEASATALAELARRVALDRHIGLGQGRMTLEELVREMLRPLLKAWLDENLPAVVERIVQKEIERLVNRADPL